MKRIYKLFTLSIIFTMILSSVFSPSNVSAEEYLTPSNSITEDILVPVTPLSEDLTILNQGTENDTYEVTPYFLPVVAYIVGTTVVRGIVTRVGSRYVFTVGSKVYNTVPATNATNAVKNFQTLTFNAGHHSYKMTKDDMAHILQRHHLNYWSTPPSTQAQTFFPESMSVNEIRNIALSVASQNRTKLAQGIRDKEKIRGTVNGVDYEMGISAQQHFRTLYPVNP